MEILAVTTTSNRAAIEGYLAHKWGLSSSLASSNSFKVKPPPLSDSISGFSADSAISSGKSLDLSNGVFAEVSTGGTEDTFDGGSNFSVSMWVKGWPSSDGQPLVSKNKFDPKKMGNLKKLVGCQFIRILHHRSRQCVP